jgi:hypothetical protein
MINYRFEETITTDDGDRVAFPILVHELHSRPHALEGVPEWASDDETDRAVAQLEEQLGFDLEWPDVYDDVRLSDEYRPKRAGLDRGGGSMFEPFVSC